MRGRKPVAERLLRERDRSEHFRQIGSEGGKRSLKTMTAEERSERARKAVAAREAKRAVRKKVR
jgi:hypothetical protein